MSEISLLVELVYVYSMLQKDPWSLVVAEPKVNNIVN